MITTHVLDTHQGRPAVGITVVLEILGQDGKWQQLADAITNEDGRILSQDFKINPDKTDTISPTTATATMRLTFKTAAYYEKQKIPTFYPEISISFIKTPERTHIHVPLLLNAYGFTTYRGT